MSKLELYNIYAGYEESKPVLKDISFFVEKGEFIVLLGTSGCGKTTILNLIAGMIPISAGELYIDGVKSNDTPPRKRNIAMVFQNYALYPTMTAYENIAFPLQNAHYKKKDIDSSVKSIAVELASVALTALSIRLYAGAFSFLTVIAIVLFFRTTAENGTPAFSSSAVIA